MSTQETNGHKELTSGYPEIGSDEQKETGVKTKFRKLYANLSIDAMMGSKNRSSSSENNYHEDEDSEDDPEDEEEMSNDDTDDDDIFQEAAYNPEPISTPDIEFLPTVLPNQEPQETLSVKYLGSIASYRPSGVDVLNDAMEKIMELNRSSEACAAEAVDDESKGPEEFLIREQRNIPCLIRVSPSAIVVESSVSGSSQTVLDLRVRFLSFMGIHKTDTKVAGFIMQSGDKSFTAHCFECEPDAGEFCRIIQTACKRRYEKCMDGHKQRLSVMKRSSSAASALSKSATASVAAVKNAFSKIWIKK